MGPIPSSNSRAYLVKNLGLGKSDKALNYKLVKRLNRLSKILVTSF